MLDQQTRLYRLLPELAELDALVERAAGKLRVLDSVTLPFDDMNLPVPVYAMGSDAPDAPAIGLFGGVHGVERIGMEVVIAYMQSLVEGLSWAPSLQEQIAQMYIVFMPLVNPGGVIDKTRCNPNGVDLMRNAPLDAECKVSFPAGGQRLSRHLPWYRGKQGAPMEPEAENLCNVVRQHMLGRPFALSLDCHSGYGMRDHIWFPYAGSRKPFPQAAEILAMKKLFDRTYPNHTYYKIGPQALHYITHGDLWDYLHAEAMQQGDDIFIPLTLEMGAWQWIKKNPRQLFRFPGLFNPVLPHRHRRILRRHLVLIDFLLRAVHGYRHWLPGADRRSELTATVRQQWYSNYEH